MKSVKTVVFDFKQLTDLTDFYTQFAKEFKLPKYFGANLDALWDMITGYISLPVNIEFQHVDSQKRKIFQQIIQLFEDAEKEEYLHFRLIDEDDKS